MRMMLDRFFSDLTGAQRVALFFFVVAVSAVLLAYFAGGWQTGIPIGVLVLAILWLIKPVWTPPGDTGRTKVRLTSLAVVSSVAVTVLGKTPEAKSIFVRILEKIGLKHTSAEAAVNSANDLTVGLVLAFVLIAVFAINWFARDRSAMRKHPKPIDKDFPDQSYRDQLRRYAQILEARLNALDEETKWDDYLFTPLEAEVEILSGRQSMKKVVDLMQALKANQASRIVLLLGDPGSGKSIALRKLAKELLAEVDKTGRIPVYINLKEWDPGRKWTENHPPTAQELRNFILNSLRGQSLFADQFLTDYFTRMLDRGRFFFLLDSFDEIPAVLDVSEASSLIQSLSRLITEFFLSQDAGRGIVASRFYRRPNFGRLAVTTLEVRPFSDLRIHDALQRSNKLRGSTIENLFAERAELIPIARNPFSAALIRLYAESHAGELPAKQLEMYDSYTRARLDRSIEQLQPAGLSTDQLIQSATEIAWSMFYAPDIGLEAPIARLKELLKQLPVEDVTNTLRYAGLARLSPPPSSRFSFVHRRLNEYFVARRFLEAPQTVREQAIPTDSRYRDALVLYCEVGAVEHVTSLAEFCWREICLAGTADIADISAQLRAVHCLRFLSDAFRARPECITFERALSEYITSRLRREGDLLGAKLAVEATGVLSEDTVEPILVGALELENPWISTTALRACRHLKRLSPGLEDRLHRYLSSIDPVEFLRRYAEISFSLSLSDAFSRLRRYCRLRAIDERAFIAAWTTCVLFAPIVAVLILLGYLAQKVMTSKYTGRTRTLLRIEVGAFLFVAALSAASLSRAFSTYHGFMTEYVCPLLAWAHGIATLCVLAAYLILAAAISPWLDMIIGASKWRRVLRLLTLKTVSIGLTILVSYALFIVAFIAWIPFARFTRFLVIAMVGTGSMIGLIAGLRELQRLIIDRRRFQEVSRNTNLSRISIAGDFLSFKTHYFRRSYVEWLRDSVANPQGTWPGARPNVKGDEASTMLAQLDERWLGLDV